MIRCFLPKDVGTVCTKIPGGWVHNKKQNINDNISFVPSSHCLFFFFICWLYPWVPLLLLLAFMTSDLQLGKGKFCFVLFSIWKAPSAWTWLSLHVTPIPQEHHGTSFGLKRALMSLSWEPSSTSSSSQLSLWKRASPPSLWASVSSETRAVLIWWAKISCSSGDFSGPVIFCSIICPHHSLSELDGSPHFLGEQTQVQKHWPD